MFLAEFVNYPILPVAEYWWAYVCVYYLAASCSDRTRKAVNLDLSILSEYALTITSFCSGEVLAGNVTKQNAVKICDLSRRIALSLLRAEKEKLISKIELI